MTDQAPRYAVYFVPAANSGLYRFGSSVLQYDCYTGEPLAAPDECAADVATWRKATEEPRRYGFHATLKAPFRLAPSCSEAQLVSAFRSFAGLGRAAASIEPEIRMLSGFAALVPAEANPAVDTLAADCTRIFDAFRAPMSAQERARRLASGLNAGQIENLDRWGYPYLFADFRFHMTLTGKIEAARREPMVATLGRAFARMCGATFIAVDRLALVRQDASDQSFRVLDHALLRTA